MASRGEGVVMTTMTMEKGKGLFPKEELEVVYNASTPLILIDWSSATTSNICPTIYWWRDIHERHTRVISLAFAFRSGLSIYGNTGTGLLWTYLISFIFLHKWFAAKKFYTWKSVDLQQNLSRDKTMYKILHSVSHFRLYSTFFVFQLENFTLC